MASSKSSNRKRSDSPAVTEQLAILDGNEALLDGDACGPNLADEQNHEHEEQEEQHRARAAGSEQHKVDALTPNTIFWTLRSIMTRWYGFPEMLMSMLTPTDIATLHYVLRITPNPEHKDKYMHISNEIPLNMWAPWKDTSGVLVTLVGVDTDLLVNRIYNPKLYWSERVEHEPINALILTHALHENSDGTVISKLLRPTCIGIYEREYEDSEDEPMSDSEVWGYYIKHLRRDRYKYKGESYDGQYDYSEVAAVAGRHTYIDKSNNEYQTGYGPGIVEVFGCHARTKTVQIFFGTIKITHHTSIFEELERPFALRYYCNNQDERIHKAPIMTILTREDCKNGVVYDATESVERYESISGPVNRFRDTTYDLANAARFWGVLRGQRASQQNDEESAIIRLMRDEYAKIRTLTEQHTGFLKARLETQRADFKAQLEMQRADSKAQLEQEREESKKREEKLEEQLQQWREEESKAQSDKVM